MLHDQPDDLLAYDRRAASERWIVLVNFTPVPVACPADGMVAIASDGEGEGERYPGRLGPDQAVVLRASVP